MDVTIDKSTRRTLLTHHSESRRGAGRTLGLDYLPDLLAVIRKEAGKAAKDGEKLAEFRALRLNQGVSDVRESWLMDPDTWASIEREDTPRWASTTWGLISGRTHR